MYAQLTQPKFNHQFSFGIVFVSGIPTVFSSSRIDILIEKGLGGNQRFLSQAAIDLMLGAEEVNCSKVFGKHLTEGDSFGFVIENQPSFDHLKFVKMMFDDWVDLVEPQHSLDDVPFKGLQIIKTKNGHIAGRFYQKEITNFKNNNLGLIQFF